MLNHVKQQGYSLKTVSYEQWKRDLITFAETNPGRGWNVYLPLIADVDAQVLQMPRFGQENTKAGLKGSSIKSKPLDRRLLDAYFKYFIESGRIPPPSNKNGSNGS